MMPFSLVFVLHTANTVVLEAICEVWDQMAMSYACATLPRLTG
jgi:hypothetical protein